MLQATQSTRNKHQLRTEDTRARILDAAQALFSEQGFENTQLEQVAARAGFTRGAIYAHYSSKEDLFLSLLEQRAQAKIAAVHAALGAEPAPENRIALFRAWIAGQVCDRSWGALTLEFKLYALRRPSSRQKLQHLSEILFSSSARDLVDLLFGSGLSRSTRTAIERRLAVMGAVLGAVVLESHFRPELLPAPQVQALILELFDSLVHA